MSEHADLTSEHIEGMPADDGVHEIPLFSRIGHNLWMGGCPTDSIPGDTQFIVSLYPWAEYTVPEGITVTRAWLYDYDIVPDVQQLVALARWVSSVRKIGPVLVHCQAGLNRSGLITALAMMVDGADAATAIDHLRACRDPYVLCNRTFERWLREYGAEAIERHP